MSKVFIFGIDGATFDLILPWVEAGKLPHFARLMKDGSWGHLASAPNMRSPAAWSSFITGKNPGKHGIYEFYEPVPGTYQVRFVHGGMRKGASLWRILSDAGKRVGVINVPMTYPAERVNGFLIAGLDAPGVQSEGFCYPPEIRSELRREFGEYILEPGLTGCIARGRPDLGAEKLREELAQKEQVTTYLMRKYPWDCFVVVFRSLDAAQHCYWKYMDPLHPHHDPEEAQRYGSVVLDAYRQLDRSLGAIRDMLDDDATLIVMSDHGFGRKHAASSQLNRWLASREYLRYAGRQARLSSFGAKVAGMMYKAIIARTSRRTKEALARWFPRLRNRIQSQMCYSNIDWSRTKLYADGLFPSLRVNLKGREPAGIVSPGEEYERLIERVKAEIAECRDSVTGKTIVDRVFHRDEIYTGPYRENAPDLLIRWREDTVIHGLAIDGAASEDPTHRAEPKTMIPGEDPEIISGDHKFYGVLLMAGSAVRRANRVNGARLIDLAPTVLSLLGVPMPSDMDGRVLTEALHHDGAVFDPAAKRHAPPGEPRHAAEEEEVGYSDEEQGVIAQRLRDLGYIE